MVLEKGIVNKNIIISDQDFDIDKIYKNFKEKADDLGYGFVEKEQGTKSSKYGNEVKFEFLLDKEIDYFGELFFNVRFDFTRLSKIKNLDHGNCKITINGKVIFDYKNRWGMTKFNRFLLGLYLKVTEPEMKRKYIIPLIITGSDIQNSIKNSFDLYVG